MAAAATALWALLVLMAQQGVAEASRRPNDGGGEAPPPGLGYEALEGAGAYLVKEERVSWPEAQAACQAASGHLLVLDTSAEVKALRSLLASRPRNVSNELHAGFFRPDFFITVFGSSFSYVGYQRWAADQQSTQTCGTVNHNMLLYDAKCSDKRSFICEYKKNVISSLKLDDPPLSFTNPPQRKSYTPSKTGILNVPYKGLMPQGRMHYYAVYEAKQRWSMAKSHCETDGGHLLVLNHQMEADVLKEHIKQFKQLSDALYVGLRNGNNNFVTVFGESLSHAVTGRWESEQPEDETCLTVNHDMLLKKAPCWEERSYICEMTLT